MDQNKVASFLWNNFKAAQQLGPEAWYFIKVPDKHGEIVSCLGKVYNAHDFVSLGLDEITLTDRALLHLNNNGFKDAYTIVEKVVYAGS